MKMYDYANEDQSSIHSFSVLAHLCMWRRFKCPICNPKGAFKVAAKMLMKEFTRRKRKGGQMDKKWLGPYYITRCLGTP